MLSLLTTTRPPRTWPPYDRKYEHWEAAAAALRGAAKIEWPAQRRAEQRRRIRPILHSSSSVVNSNPPRNRRRSQLRTWNEWPHIASQCGIRSNTAQDCIQLMPAPRFVASQIAVPTRNLNNNRHVQDRTKPSAKWLAIDQRVDT